MKNNRKTKEEKNILAKKERKKRKKQKMAKDFALKTLNAKKKRAILFLILKKNLLPALALTSGCFIFYFSNYYDFIPSFYLTTTRQEKATEVTIAKFDNLPGNRPLGQHEKINQINKAPIYLAEDGDQKYHYPSEIKYALFADSDIIYGPSSALDNFLILPVGEKNEKTETENKNSQPDKSEKSTEIIITPLPEKTQKKTYPVRYADNDPYAENEALRTAIAKIIKDTPMEAMLDEIVARDRAVAAFLIGIGMKESKYGIYSPKKEGAECFNYWGYRGRENRTKSGYSCFDSPEHAVEVVGNRIEAFINRGLDTPAKLIVWKCGYSCKGHSEESVDKWIADVSIHYYRLNPVLRELVVR